MLSDRAHAACTARWTALDRLNAKLADIRDAYGISLAEFVELSDLANDASTAGFTAGSIVGAEAVQKNRRAA